MTDIFFAIYLCIIAVSFLASASIYFNKQSPGYLQLFPPFLLITAITEALGHYVPPFTTNNHILYHIYFFIYFPFYFLFLRQVIKHKNIKKAILYTLLPYTFIYLLVSITGKMETYFTSLYVSGSFLLLCFCGLYFYEWMQATTADRLTKQPSFWICSGLLFFQAGALPLLAANKFIESFPAYSIRNLGILLLLINYVFYSLVAVAFYVNRRNQYNMYKRNRPR